MQNSRRKFLKGLTALAGVSVVTSKIGVSNMSASAALKVHSQVAEQSSSPFTLPDLPYAANALEPVISANAFSFHHGKHHKAYVDKANELVAGTEYASMSLEEVIKKTAGDSSKGVLFNNVAQIWNHTFFWNSMKPNGGGLPTGAIAKKIDEDFGSFDKFKEEFKNAGMTQFGSGWVWLVLENGKLKVTKTPNADLPMAHGQVAILTCDVWEHAYYIDFQNRRPDFLTAFLEKLVNWDFANKNLAAAS